MANIIPITSATGSAPLMINEHKGNAESGSASTIGTIRGSSDKAAGGLDVQAAEVATSVQVNDNVAGKNGRQYTAGLSNTDLSAAVTGIHMTGNANNRIDINTVANAGMNMHFINGIGFTNYRTWTIRGNNSSIGNDVGYDVYVIDPSLAGTEADIGTYDETSLDQWAYTMDTQGGYSSNYAWFFINKQWRVLKTKAGACAIYGASASFQDYHDNAVTEAWTLYAVAPNLFRIVCPFKIGDGTTTGAITQSDMTLFTPAGQANGGVDQFHIQSDSVPFYLDLISTNTVTLNRVIFNWGEASLFDLNSSVGATVVLNDCSFIGMGDATLGSDLQCNSVFTLASGSDVILEGANIDNSIINGDCLMNKDTDLTNVTITGDLRINIALNTILDFSNVTVGGNVFNDAGLNTLTINASNGSSLTTTEPGTGSGEVDIQNLVNLTFNVQDKDKTVIVNAQVSIYDSSLTQLMNEDTNIGGIATETYNYISAEDIKWRVRKSEITDNPRYLPQSGTGQIGANGFSLTITLKENPNI